MNVHMYVFFPESGSAAEARRRRAPLVRQPSLDTVCTNVTSADEFVWVDSHNRYEHSMGMNSPVNSTSSTLVGSLVGSYVPPKLYSSGGRGSKPTIFDDDCAEFVVLL